MGGHRGCEGGLQHSTGWIAGECRRGGQTGEVSGGTRSTRLVKDSMRGSRGNYVCTSDCRRSGTVRENDGVCMHERDSRMKDCVGVQGDGFMLQDAWEPLKEE